MRRPSFHAISPAGLAVDTVTTESGRMWVMAHPIAPDAACSGRGQRSAKVHSRYARCLLDLPAHGRSVHVRVQVRRFRCGNAGCPRRIFAEVLDPAITQRAARRTARLDGVVHHLGLALGGRPAARIADWLMLSVSRDTLLRLVHRRAMPAGTAAVRVVGIDDFAWKRGQRYGTIICDLEKRRIMDLLPDREAGTAGAWLAEHPEIRVVSRDRGGGYGRAATQGAPQVMQVADRWHLMENASAAFLDAVRRSMRPIRHALGSTVIDPALLTYAERIQHDGFVRRQEGHQAITAMAAYGISIKAITRQTDRSRKLARSVLRGGDGDVFRSRATTLEAHLALLGAAWDAGCHNGAELWRRLRAGGFRGGLRVVTEWATRQRRSEEAGAAMKRAAPPARHISRLMTMQREQLSRGDAITVATIETAVPALATARLLLERFHRMLRVHDAKALSPWLAEAGRSLLASSSKGINADVAAVRAALTEIWSNGQTEGQITKLKLVKRQMYGRAGLDLLRARLIGAA